MEYRLRVVALERERRDARRWHDPDKHSFACRQYTNRKFRKAADLRRSLARQAKSSGIDAGA